MNVLETSTQILDAQAIKRKIKRMALQMAEQNTGEEHLVLAGIVGHGVVVAHLLAHELNTIAGIKTDVITIVLDKVNPFMVSIEPAIDLKNKIIIITDDVANTGKTMFYALQPFFSSDIKKIQTAVLVERSHKEFPIQTDYTGLSIATTLQEHIAVKTEGEELAGAWLY